jgi:hypothetical protein
MNTKREAVRILLTENPHLPPEDGIVLLQKRWNITMNKRHFSSAKYRFLKKPSRKQTSEPDFDSLLKVREIAKEYSGVKEFAELVKEVADAANQVGGLTRLKESLQALHDLGVSAKT